MKPSRWSPSNSDKEGLTVLVPKFSTQHLSRNAYCDPLRPNNCKTAPIPFPNSHISSRSTIAAPARPYFRAPIFTINFYQVRTSSAEKRNHSTTCHGYCSMRELFIFGDLRDLTRSFAELVQHSNEHRAIVGRHVIASAGKTRALLTSAIFSEHIKFHLESSLPVDRSLRLTSRFNLMLGM